MDRTLLPMRNKPLGDSSLQSMETPAPTSGVPYLPGVQEKHCGITMNDSEELSMLRPRPNTVFALPQSYTGIATARFQLSSRLLASSSSITFDVNMSNCPALYNALAPGSHNTVGRYGCSRLDGSGAVCLCNSQVECDRTE